MTTLSSWKTLSKHRWFIVLATIIVALAAYLVSVLRPTTYDSSISLRVNRINKQQTQYYDDSYFAIQASDLFSQTVISWFLTPSVLLEIYTTAGVDPKVESLDRFPERFTVKKFSPQNIVVRFTERDQTTAQKIGEAIPVVIEKKATEINQTADHQALFEVKGERVVTVPTNRQTELMTILGAVIGLVGSVILVFAKDYLSEEQEVTSRGRS